MTQTSYVTVVGGSGFLGRYVVKHLAQRGYTVRVLCRRPSAATHLKPAGSVGQIVPDYADLAKPDTLKGKFKGSFAVINLVGKLFESGNQKFARIHAQGAERLAQEAKAEGVQQFIQISALGIDHAKGSRYARTKLDGEKAVRAIFPDAVILRPSVIFGAEDNFFNFFAKLSAFSPALPAIGGGKTLFQPVYVDDVAKAILAALERSDCAGKTYELGGPQTYRFKELLSYLGEVTGHSRALAPVPFTIAGVIGALAQLLPNPPLTRDQVELLKTDNVVGKDALGFKALGIEPQPLEAIVPHYLSYTHKAA